MASPRGWHLLESTHSWLPYWGMPMGGHLLKDTHGLVIFLWAPMGGYAPWGHTLRVHPWMGISLGWALVIGHPWVGHVLGDTHVWVLSWGARRPWVASC